MEPQGNNKLGYLVGALAIILLIVLFAWFVVGHKKVVSPVPEEGIKVIFTSPTPPATPTATATATATPKATVKPTPKPSPSPTISASPTASPTASPVSF